MDTISKCFLIAICLNIHGLIQSGFFFHDGQSSRQHINFDTDKLFETTASSLKPEVLLTSFDHTSSIPEAKLALIVYDANSKSWLVSYAIINNPPILAFKSIEDAQDFVLRHLRSASTSEDESKQQSNFSGNDTKKPNKSLLVHIPRTSSNNKNKLHWRRAHIK